jgi:hypothetical protein
VRARLVSTLVFAAIASACGPSIHVRTDFETTADFSKYRTFAVKQGNSTGNPIMDRRIVAGIEETLRAKGFMIVSEPAADAIVVEHAATRERHTYEVFYDGWVGWGWRWGWGAPIVERYDFTVGTLVADIFDAGTRQAIWHGSASGVVSDDPQKNAKAIQIAINRMFERFPPRVKA